MSNKSSNLSKLASKSSKSNKSNKSSKSNKSNSIKKNKTTKIRKTKMIETQKKTIKNKKKQAIKKVIIIMDDDSEENMNIPEISMKIPPPTEKIETDLKISSVNNISTIPMEKEVIVTTNMRWNEKFIDLMEKLAEIMLKQGEPFRARAYQKAQETIMAFPDDIKSPDDLKGLPGIGDTIMEKLKEYVNTGTLKVLEREKNNPVNILTDIYGIGPKKAKELVEKQGIKSIEDLRKNKQLLNDIQIVGLDNYEDVLKRIPRSEIDEFDKYFKGAFLIASSTDSNAEYEIVGSYRRGAENSGDIDVIITSDKSEVFKKFIDKLINDKIITHVLSRGPTKCLVIAKLPDKDSTARRVDFLYSNKEEYPFSVLYFTGSKIFNTVMRHQALTMGYTMNEHGMYKMEGKKKGEKVDHVFKNEKDIFDFLNMEYKEPKERKDGRSVVIKGSQPKTNKVSEVISEIKETIMNAVPSPTPVPSIPIPILETKMDDVSPPDEIVIVKKDKTKKIKKNKSLKNKEKILENIQKITQDEMKKITENKKNVSQELILEKIKDFQKNGISVLDGLLEEELVEILNYANIRYRNMDPVMNDNEFDILEDYINNKYPDNPATKKIGAPIAIEKNKVKLPYEMWSMDKIKPDTNALEVWCEKYKGPYVLSCKLDGVSGLYTTEGKEPKLYTRGDGKIGQDVSHLIPYLKLPKEKNIVIRGEFIMKKNVFQEKYSSEFANPRNLVSGIVNRQTIDDKVKDLDFVSYEVIKPELKPSDQMIFLSFINVICVLNKTYEKISNELLSKTLLEWRKDYIYEIDGIIVTDDQIYPRKSGNPEHAFAFKMVLSEQVAEAKVIDVIWTPSKDGYLKPRVQIEPVNLGGVKIEYATGFNGAFIEKNKIGVGALVQIVRSGDVIPHIMAVTTPAQFTKMPDVPYKWNDTHIDILLENIESDSIVREKLITAFFKGIGVEGLSGGNVARIIETGFDTIPKIIKMTKEDFLKVPGFKEKMATKLYEGIKNKLNEVSLLTLMSSSNILGRGLSEKKLEPILVMYPDILVSNDSPSQKIEMVKKVKGMASKTAQLFVNNIPKFLEFLNECGLEYKLEQTHKISQESKAIDEMNSNITHPLYNKSIIMTGFRDKNIIDSLKKVGANLGSSVSKNTFIVLTKDPTDETSKVLEAKKLGIPIMTPDEFMSKYFM